VATVFAERALAAVHVRRATFVPQLFPTE